MSKFQQFEYLKQRVQAGQTAGLKIFFAGSLGFLALGIVLFLMLRGAHSSEADRRASKSEDSSGQMTQISRVFEENEKRIKDLQSMTQSLLKQVPANSGDDSALADTRMKAKKWQARQEAQTEMYGHSHSSDQAEVEITHSIQNPRSTVVQGEFIHAVLETAINSELTGNVRAEVTEPVYAYQGDKVLIPRGSRLIGQYHAFQQNGAASARIFVIWNRIVTPAGLSLLIESPGMDALGRSGMEADDVESHFFTRFGQAILLSVIGGGVSTIGVSDQDQPNSRNQWRESLSNNLRDSASQSVDTHQIVSTLHVHQGDIVNVFVAKDLEFPV